MDGGVTDAITTLKQISRVWNNNRILHFTFQSIALWLMFERRQYSVRFVDIVFGNNHDSDEPSIIG